jgi:GDPmannose 4,6-dehydratase
MAYGLHISCGILFNHESPRRGPTFITRKVCRAVARIKAGLQDKLEVGNLKGQRDWGWAPDYVEAMWMMLQKEEPDDYVISTGKSYYVWELCKWAFEYAGLDWRDYVTESPRLKRPLEVPFLLGDSSKAKRVLGWEHTVDFYDMISIILHSEMEALK